MGDRCEVTVYVRSSERSQFVAVIGYEPAIEEAANDGGSMVELTFEEANYAFYTELQQAAAKGLHFTAYNTSGSEYPAGVTVCDGKTFLECRTDGDYRPIVTVPVEQTDVDNALAVLAMAEKLKGGK